MRVVLLDEYLLWSSEGRHVGDAWAHGGEEGRGKLREARGSGTHAVIPRWPNGATRRSVRTVITSSEVKRTQGTETSQYLEEEKSTEMSGVAASGSDPSPNRSPWGTGVVGPADAGRHASRSPLERGARDGQSPGGGRRSCPYARSVVAPG